ncbi:hypothetical protein GQ457_01G019250 [Hibiscus cannabinus]
MSRSLSIAIFVESDFTESWTIRKLLKLRGEAATLFQGSLKSSSFTASRIWKELRGGESKCVFSKHVWEAILDMVGVAKAVGSWKDEVLWAVRNLRGKKPKTILRRLSWIAYIYNIWTERNFRQFRNQHNNIDTIVKGICDIVLNRFMHK